jgi:hypothetical protein
LSTLRRFNVNTLVLASGIYIGGGALLLTAIIVVLFLLFR